MRPHLLAAAIATVLSTFALNAKADVTLDEIFGHKISLEGLIQSDYTQYDDDISTLSDDGELRRAEIVLKGKATNWEWVVGYDASTRNDKFLDVNAKFKLGSKLSWTVGQFKQPNSMEELSSTKNNDFVAKAMVTSTYSPGRRVGTSLMWTDTLWTLTGSVFGDEITTGGGEGNGFGGRFTFAPINTDGNILHFGLSGITYDTHNDEARVRARPGMDMSTTPRLIDSGTLRDADDITTYGLEGGWVAGPFKINAEYFESTIARHAHSDYTTDGWYASGLWNLTGETWGYRNGVFTTNKAGHGGYMGMWQLGLRAEELNLKDGGVNGGKETNYTVGLNWYFRQNFKFMLNYVKTDIDRPNGTNEKPSALELRGQLYW